MAKKKSGTPPPTPSEPRRRGLRVKGVDITVARVVSVVLGILAIVFVVQNTARVRIHLFASDLVAPLWAALLAMGLIGLLVGFVLARRRSRD